MTTTPATKKEDDPKESGEEDPMDGQAGKDYTPKTVQRKDG